MGDVTFDGYTVTTTNPGNELVLVTLAVCIFIFFVGIIILPDGALAPFFESLASCSICTRSVDGGQREKDNEQQEVSSPNQHVGRNDQNTYYLQQGEDEEGGLTTRKKKSLGRKRYSGMQSSNSIKQLFKVTPKTQKQNGNMKAKNKNEKKAKKKKKKNSTRIGRYEEKLKFEDFHIWKSESISSLLDGPLSGQTIYGNKNSIDDRSVLTEEQSVDESFLSENDLSLDSNGDEVAIIKEMRKMVDLAAPWIFQSFVTDITSIIYMMLISHYLGLGELVCYSSVWFLLSSGQIFADSWHSSVYKHIIAAVGKETSEGYTLAGKYVKIGSSVKFGLMVPTNIAITLSMPYIMKWIGYDNKIVEMSQSFAAVASVAQIIEYCASTFTSLLEIEGYARFNAIFDFWDATIGLSVSAVFIIFYEPTLLELGLLSLLIDVISTLYYMNLTYKKRKMFDYYKQGLIAPIESSTPIKSMIKAAVPFLYLSITDYAGDLFLAGLASYQGAAEAATWILLGYVWGIVEIGPECIASAATVRVEHNLSRGNIETAKKIANRTLVICTALALVISLLLLDTRNYLAWCFSLDETLEEMIYEIIPYIAICQPFITVGVTAEYLNEALGKYKMSVKISAFIDAVFTYPIAAIFTYELNYNIEGLASAVCMGYAATGITNLIIYANTNWERATAKIQRYTEEG